MNLVVDAVLRVNKAANDELDKVNDLNNWSKDNVTHIHVFYVSQGHKLVNGAWVESAPF